MRYTLTEHDAKRIEKRLPTVIETCVGTDYGNHYYIRVFSRADGFPQYIVRGDMITHMFEVTLCGINPKITFKGDFFDLCDHLLKINKN